MLTEPVAVIMAGYALGCWFNAWKANQTTGLLVLGGALAVGLFQCADRWSKRRGLALDRLLVGAALTFLALLMPIISLGFVFASSLSQK